MFEKIKQNCKNDFVGNCHFGQKSFELPPSVQNFDFVASLSKKLKTFYNDRFVFDILIFLFTLIFF